MSTSGSHVDPKRKIGYFAERESPASSERTKRDFGRPESIEKEAPTELVNGVLLAGRYLVLRRLGRGGFSDVYLAHDHQLDRPVAVKRLLLGNVDPRFIKEEAKTLASLDHPGIVRIYDVCNDEQHGCLVIMQYVCGPVLRELLTKPLPIIRAVEIVIRIAGGLVHAHSRGVIHRDIKPTNILMSSECEPLIADFGLAFTPSSHCQPEGGTPRYMSPEQIRNEAKRIGPSSDVFSTGILLYEMLAGRVPFNGRTEDEIAKATLEQSPEPISTINPVVPFELDQIVQRALRKSLKDRYGSMDAFQADLILWLAGQEMASQLSTIRTPEFERAAFESTFASSTFRSAAQFTHRGLQPFESEDSRFFLRLVPGAKASNGLPQSVHFWKEWIESGDNDKYARIGVLYGPSGSGKTSLLRAGIVPHLAPDVLPIVVDCYKGESLSHISSTISSQINHYPTGDLVELLSHLRDDPAVRGQHRKAVLIFDQFDNWAGSAVNSELAELAAVLRHCDGESLQSLLIIRDEFWTSATEFLQLIECGVEQWKNARSIELMDRHHAMRLLESAGRGYGSLPPYPEALDSAQAAFVAQAINEMSDRGRVLPIQLAMFAKMAKLLRWHPETLSQVGGVQGAYVGYFQDQFESKVAPPSYVRVSGAVVEVLKQLIPSADQSVHEHSTDFNQLETSLASKKMQNQLHRVLHILVEDLRVVERISKRGSLSAGQSEYTLECNDRFKLVHDFLTVPIATWVDQVCKSSWRGRSAARLEELSTMWGRKPDKRYLPTLVEFLSMQFSISCTRRSQLQNRYLSAACQKHVVRLAGLIAIASVILGAIGYGVQQRRYGLQQYQRISDLNQQHFVQRAEEVVCGEPAEFSLLLEALPGNEQIVAKAIVPWLNYPEMKQRTRARLLNVLIKRESFDSLVIDLGRIETERCMDVIRAAQSCPDARQQLENVYDNSSATPVERTRAAILLAHLNMNEPIEALLNIGNGSSREAENTSRCLKQAILWKGSPEVWIRLLTSTEQTNGLTHNLLKVLASFEEESLPSDFPWDYIARLQADESPAVSNMASWFLKRSGQAKDLVEFHSSPYRRMLTSGIEQVRIAAGNLTTSTPIRFSIGDPLTDGGEFNPEIRIERPFWMNTSAITNSRIEELNKQIASSSRAKYFMPMKKYRERREFESHPDKAATGLNWPLVFELCNLESQNAGLRPAYKVSFEEASQGMNIDKQPKVERIDHANGFRLPTIFELAYASECGTTLTRSIAYAVTARCNKELIPDPYDNRFNIKRTARELMPNRHGVHFDIDAFDCWSWQDNRIWRFCSVSDDYMVWEVIKVQPHPFNALWLVSDCED